MRQTEQPTLECDLVMRGGITSGIVYPRAVSELARRYRFRSVGGTSAGALAAAATAAAEYGRATGRSPGSFEALARLPTDLAARSASGEAPRLIELFQPSKQTKPLFDIALALMSRNATSLASRFLKAVRTMVGGFPVPALIGVLPGLYMIWAVLILAFNIRFDDIVPAAKTHLWALLGGIAGYIVLLALVLLPVGRARIVITAFVLGTTGYIGALAWYLHARAGTQGLIYALDVAGGLFVALIISMTGALLLGALATIRRAHKAIPAGMFGLCSGMTEPSGRGQPAVTDWLHIQIQRLSGLPASRPLTMGDLWLLNAYHPRRPNTLQGEPAIDLALMTTNITLGIAHRFPQMEGWRGALYFRKDELARLFPPAVVAWMVAQAGAPEEHVDAGGGFHRLPSAEHLPVLLGTRISMSFPYLLSAVPLYTVNWADTEHFASTGRYPFERCWFSDGGLTSNFPIHFFDAPVPSRPTFAINLLPAETQIDTVVVRKMRRGAPEVHRVERVKRAGPGDPGANPQWQYVWMPGDNEPEIHQAMRFNRFDRRPGPLGGFFWALFDTARNSADTAQMFLPGYRDRIVHIAMQEHEGGLNLDMPQEIIEALGMRGELAGRLLTERFAPDVHVETRTGEPIALDWNNHRWVRYRMFMASLEATVRAFATRWQNDAQNADRLPPGYLTLKDLLERSRDRIGRENLGWYSEEQWLHARANTESLVAAVSTWQSPHDTFDATVDEHGQPIAIGGAPEPRPLLRVVPPDEISAPSVASQPPGHQQMPPSRMPEPRR